MIPGCIPNKICKSKINQASSRKNQNDRNRRNIIFKKIKMALEQKGISETLP